MNLMIRPSKSFLFDLLEKELASARGEVGLDAASANFKNRRMFRTRFYYGLDYDLDLLKQGLKKFPDEQTFGIHADIARLDALPDNSVDAVVSTNTLYQLELGSRRAAQEHLCRICKPEGKFLCELTKDKDFDVMLSIIRSSFSEVKIIYYRNPVSRFYESLFERNGNLGSHPIAGARLFRLFVWLLSRLEYLTYHFKSLNRRAFVICSKKSGRQLPQKFDLSSFPLQDSRIYEMISK